jgi:hypothetical protein
MIKKSPLKNLPVENSEIFSPKFFNYRQLKDFLRAGIYMDKAEILGDERVAGIRNKFRLFTFEKHVGDYEPKLDHCRGLRIVAWQRFFSATKPAGWRTDFMEQLGMKAYTFLKPNYWEDWDEQARRQRRKYLKQNDYYIEAISASDFVDFYACQKLNISNILKDVYVKSLKWKIKYAPESLKCFVARAKSDKQIIAGLVALEFQNPGISVHYIAFHLPLGREFGAGYGLIDYWYDWGLKRGIKILDFDNVNNLEHKPADWEGFSQFKRHFRLNYVKLPRLLLKITWG